jgi:hypothetical protein
LLKPAPLRCRPRPVHAALLRNQTMMTIINMRARSPAAMRRTLLAAFLLCVTAPGYASDNEWQHDWTVLTLASNGAWGAGTHTFIHRALASAIRDCKAMSSRPDDCGAKASSVRSGWSVGMLCGDQIIIVAAKQLAEAERRALDRETELRRVYHPNMAACVRVVTVNPFGMVSAPHVHTATRR